ncbi:MAG: hypothetical protein ABWY82_23625 [Tardiphaga sp.]
MVDSNGRLQAVMSRLEDCQRVLVDAGERDTAQLVAMAILQLRMRLHHIGDAELKALCDALTPEQDEMVCGVVKASGDCSS